MKFKFSNQFFIFLLLIFVFFLFLFFGIFSSFSFSEIESFIENSGFYGPLIFIVLMALAIIVSPIPSLPLAGIGGMVFGPIMGVLYTLIGAMIGAMIAFILARYFGEKIYEMFFNKEFKFFDGLSENRIMLFIFLMRLFPFFQFDIVSYGSGFTNIKLWKFLIATFFGMIPMTILFVYFGVMIKFNIWLGLLITIIFILAFYLSSKWFEKNGYAKG